MILGRTGFARKGEWIAAVTYDALDIVTHEGKVYIGRRESVGSEPSSESNDWVMLPGAPSFEITETASGYDLTITGSDGTSETISILNGEVDREELEDALEAFRSSTDAYLAPDYDDTATYSIGDSCIYDGRLYRCIEDIPTAEPWTAEHWEPVVLSNKVAQMRKDVVVKADVVVSSAEPGDVVVIADGADSVPVKELVVGIEPVQSGSGDPSPTNVRPISGWTGVEVYQSGKNMLDNQLVSGTYNGCTIIKNADGSITVSGTPSAQTRRAIHSGVFWNGKYFGRTSFGTFPSGTRVFSRRTAANGTVTYPTLSTNTLDENAVYDQLTLEINTSYGGTPFTIYPQIELGLTATAYEPYNGTTILISWQSEAGTVYGGSLDLTTGVLKVEWVRMLFNGTQAVGLANWRPYDDSSAWLYRPEITPNIDVTMLSDYTFNVISDTLKSIPYGAADGGVYGDNIGISLVGSSAWGIAMRVPVSGLDTATKINNYLAQNPIDVVYKLAQSVQYQLSETQIRSLFGVNTFWSNSNGGIQSLRYVSDLKLYLEQLTKPTEDDMVANSNIPANTYFTIGNALYLSTAAIAAGEKIEPDTNCTRKSLADALNDLHG